MMGRPVVSSEMGNLSPGDIICLCRMRATILRLQSSHVAFKSHPKDEAAFIRKAVQF